MSYEEQIRSILADSSKWPTYSNPNVISKLDEMADDAIAIDKVDETSCIASILILQQITEELIGIQLKMCRFLVQVRLLPFQIEFKESGPKMFGRLVEDLKSTIDFPHKEQMIELANRINRERVEIAHGLITTSDNKDFVKSALNVRSLFEEYFKLHENSYDWLCLCLKDLKQEVLGE